MSENIFDKAVEGIEKGKIVFDRLEGEAPKGYEWKDKEIDLVINDLDSRYDGKGNNSQGKGAQGPIITFSTAANKRSKGNKTRKS